MLKYYYKELYKKYNYSIFQPTNIRKKVIRNASFIKRIKKYFFVKSNINLEKFTTFAIY